MKTLALALLALAAASAPAAAQVAPAYASYSKTDAILGGAPSALAAILARQSGLAGQSGLAEQSGAAATVTQPAFAPSPASGGAMFRPAVLPIASPTLFHNAVALDRPDVFGTVALSVSHTSLDRRWASVSHVPVGARAKAYAASVSGRNRLDRLDAVNRYVNGHVAFVSDIRQYGVGDRWVPAAETLRRGRGDCEDFAIAKLQMLRSAGFADKDLYLVILHDVARRADHAVLVVRAEGRMLVLDNGTSRIVDSESETDYRPILTFSGNKVWTHGYRRAAPPVEMASIDAPVRSAVVEMASIDTPIAPAGIAN